MIKTLVPVAMEAVEEQPVFSDADEAEGYISLYEQEQRACDALQILEDNVKVVTALEGFADFLLDNLIDGEAQTWTAEQQKMVDFQLDQIYSGSGLERPMELGLESLGQPGKTLKEHVQTLKEHALKVVKAILAAFKRAYEYISDFIHAVVAYAGRLAIQARRLEVASRELKPTPTAETYKDKYLARQLYTLDGDVPRTYQSVMELVFGAVQVANGPLVTEVEHLLTVFSDKQTNREMPNLAEVVEKNYRPAFAYVNINLPWSTDNFDVPEDCTVFETPFLFNGAVGVCIVPNKNRDLNKFEFRIIETGKYDDHSKDLEEVEVSTLDEVRHLLRQVNGVCAGIHVFEKEQRKFDSLNRELATLQSRIANVTGDLSHFDTEVLKVLGKIAPKIVSGLHRASFAYAVNVSRQVLNHCRKSMAQYEAR